MTILYAIWHWLINYRQSKESKQWETQKARGE